MTRIAPILAGLAFLSLAARAADEKVEVKDQPDHKVIEKTKKSGKLKHHTKVESKAHKRAGGGTVSTTETKQETDRPGMGNDSKTTVKETTERDAQGNVVRQEKKTDH